MKMELKQAANATINMKEIDLEDKIVSAHTIYCSKCRRKDSETQWNYCDAKSVLESFFRAGWRLIDDKVLCPMCSGFGPTLQN